MERQFYPKVEMKDFAVVVHGKKYTSLTLSTTLRKKHNGKWYLWEFFKKHHLPFNDEASKIQALNRFHSEVYFTVVCGKVSVNSVDHQGQKVFKEDTSQISESDRIKGLLYF
jgi:hypothetical protein